MNSNNKIKLNMDSLKTSKEWVRHKVKNGSNIYRILPPFGDSSNGYPYRKWQIIWGLSDPTSGRVRPYASPMMSEKRCPVNEYVELLRERLSKMDGDLKTRGFDEKAIRKHPKFERLSKFTRDITPKTTYIYNAADKAGVVGLLELKATAHKDMKTCMNDYIRDYNQDPTTLNSQDDDSGVWFNVKRTGEGFDTEYKVEKVQNKVKAANGAVSFVDDRQALADVIVENFDNLAYDLSSVYKSTTYDEVNDVLQANMDTFHKVCPEANLSVSVDLDSEDVEAVSTPVKVSIPQVVTKPIGKAPVALNLQDDDDEEVAKPKVAMKKAPAAVLDDDDFMRQADAILKG